ncbi:hypothetical protein D1871_06515 [Nakamurella silvestris]|nr:hypothetical protein D1871_06515 [Nakamurella silvestris]
MHKHDLKAELHQLYAPSRTEFTLVEVPELAFLAVDGTGDPNTSTAYREAVEALYALSYAVKFAARAALDRDHVVMPLEGLWHADDSLAFTRRQKDRWRWRMMILQPDWIGAELIEECRTQVARKKDLPALPLIRHLRYAEGRSLQILHIGSYDDEAPVLERLHREFMPAAGLTFNGDHHEIYLSDPRRVAPERLRTALRQPVRPIDTTGS